MRKKRVKEEKEKKIDGFSLRCVALIFTSLHDRLSEAVLPGRVQEGQHAYVAEMLLPRAHETTLLEVRILLFSTLPRVGRPIVARETGMVPRFRREAYEEEHIHREEDLRD